MAGDKDSIRREVVSTLGDIARRYGFEAAESGRQAKIRDFDESSGFWESPTSVTAKPPRWILHLLVDQAGVSSRVPDVHGARRTAYFNTANRDVGVGCFRITPAISFDGGNTYEFTDKWDWLVWFAFSPPLPHGSSGQLLDDFDPSTGALQYMGRPQPYIAAGLVGLCDPDDAVSDGQASCTYADATAAIADVINVSPQTPDDAQEESTKEGGN